MILYSLFWRIGPRCYKNSAELYNLWIEKKKQSAVTYRGIEGDAALDLVVLIMLPWLAVCTSVCSFWPDGAKISAIVI